MTNFFIAVVVFRTFHFTKVNLKKKLMDKKLLLFGNNRGLLIFVGKKKTEYCLRKLCSIAEIIILNRPF